MLEIGQEWLLYATPFRLKETTTPADVTIPANTLALYAKDNGSGVSQLCIKNDAFAEVCIPTSGTIITGTGVAGRVAFWDDVDNLSSDADLTFAVDTLTGTKIVAVTALTLSALTATRLVLAGTAGLLGDDSTLTFVRNDGDFAAPIFLGDNSHTGVINTPAGLTINIDSDANDTGALFVIQSNTALRLSGGSRLYTINELGAFGVGSGASFGSSGQFLASAGNAASPAWTTHDSTGDPHTQYALLAGRAGGQTLIGGTASGDDLTLKSTSHATKGSVILGTTSAYDEVNDRLGIGILTPFQHLHLRGTEVDVGTLIDYFGDGPNSAFHALRHNRGTAASPTATQSGDILGNFLFQGRYGTTVGDNDIQNGAYISGVALENWTSIAHGGKLVFYATPTGATSPVDLITLKVESDTAQLLLDNHGASKQINFTFKDNGTDKWIIYKTTDNIFNIYDASSAQVIAQFNATSGLASDTAAMAVVPTISSANARAAGMRVVPSFTGAGDTPQGFFAAPTFAPSANLTTATGFLGLSVAAPGSGVTISTLIGLYGQCFFSDTAGAVTDSIAGRFAAPSMAGALKPTTSYGIFVDNMGAAGITNAIAARFAIPSGATNNWYLEFSAADDTDPTSGGGAATGRIKCLIGGNTRYIPYYT